MVSSELFGLYVAGYVGARVCTVGFHCVYVVKLSIYEDARQEAYYNTLPFRVAVNIKGTLIFSL